GRGVRCPRAGRRSRVAVRLLLRTPRSGAGNLRAARAPAERDRPHRSGPAAPPRARPRRLRAIPRGGVTPPRASLCDVDELHSVVAARHDGEIAVAVQLPNVAVDGDGADVGWFLGVARVGDHDTVAHPVDVGDTLAKSHDLTDVAAVGRVVRSV